MARKLFVFAAAFIFAAGAWMGVSRMSVLAYPTPQCSISEISGSASTPTGGSNTFTFQVLDLHGHPFPNQSILFSESGVPGSVNPTAGTTNGSGNVSTVFTAGNTSGAASITASDPSESCAGSAATQVTAGGSAGLPNTGPGGTGLPNTSTGAPGTNGVLYLALGLALMVILGGVVTLRRSRAAAS